MNEVRLVRSNGALSSLRFRLDKKIVSLTLYSKLKVRSFHKGPSRLEDILTFCKKNENCNDNKTILNCSDFMYVRFIGRCKA